MTAKRRRTAATLLKAGGAFTAVSIALGVLFDLLGGTFSGPQFGAEMLWIGGLFAPILVGGAAAVWVGDKLMREDWTGAQRALRFLLMLVSFASTAVVTTMAIRVVVARAPESIESRYRWLEDQLDAMSDGPAHGNPPPTPK